MQDAPAPFPKMHGINLREEQCRSPVKLWNHSKDDLDSCIVRVRRCTRERQENIDACQVEGSNPGLIVLTIREMITILMMESGVCYHYTNQALFILLAGERVYFEFMSL
jgi:hypothetical protein